VSKVKILAGDVPTQTANLKGERLLCDGGTGQNNSATGINLGQKLSSIEMMTDEKVKKLGGTAGWGFVGAVALGPLGAIGGMLLGGNKQRVTFAAELKDGRRFLAETDGKTWQKIQALVFS